MLSSRRAVISGVGVLAANGIGKDEFWKTLMNGVSGIGTVTQFDATDLPCRIAGEIKGFDPSKYVGRRLKPRRMGRFSQLAIAAVSMAVDDADLTIEQLQRMPMLPIVLGVSTSAMDLFANRPSHFTGPGSIPHAAGSAIVTEFDLHGRLTTTSSACTSSLDALYLAAEMVRKGEAEIVLTGGSDSSITRYVFEGIGKSGMLSKQNEAPSKASRPFDNRRDGGIIAEAAGILIVENLDHALVRGVLPYAEIGGFGSSTDPSGAEEASGMEHAMRMALANSSYRSGDISAINAHGPSDKHLDRMETMMIHKVFQRSALRIPVSSIKGCTGNPFGAVGALQAIAASLCIRNQTVLPTANYEVPDPECDLDYVVEGSRMADLRTVLLNGHGVGRQNSSIILKRVDAG
jgi:3-oxoacyl-[acyl-carrier-protein] synthase II